MHISETVTQIKVMSTPITQTLLTPPWNPFRSMLCIGNNSSEFCHCRLVCTFQSVAWMKLYSCTLFVWLLLFGIFILMFIHVAVCNNSSFFYSWAVLHRMSVSPFLYAYTCRWIFVFFPMFELLWTKLLWTFVLLS